MDKNTIISVALSSSQGKSALKTSILEAINLYTSYHNIECQDASKKVNDFLESSNKNTTFQEVDNFMCRVVGIDK